MFCSKCGANVAEGAAFCVACGQPIGGVAAAPGATASPAGYAVVRPTVAYAGFWLRFVAAIIDGILISIPFVPFYIAIFASMLPQLQSRNWQTGNPFDFFAIVMPKILLITVVGLIASWLYWGFMESSAWQATLGKKALGLMVTDMEGKRVTFGRSSGRFAAGRGAAVIPSIGGLYFFVSCICAGFTEKKQALHDMIAGCLVIRKL
jgi:uncharacterized RDD family membrane protein YckC